MAPNAEYEDAHSTACCIAAAIVASLVAAVVVDPTNDVRYLFTVPAGLEVIPIVPTSFVQSSLQIIPIVTLDAPIQVITLDSSPESSPPLSPDPHAVDQMEEESSQEEEEEIQVINLDSSPAASPDSSPPLSPDPHAMEVAPESDSGDSSTRPASSSSSPVLSDSDSEAMFKHD
jgi:hypothetical protein